MSRPMRIGVASTRGIAWRVVLFSPTDEEPYRVAYTLEYGFDSKREAMTRAGEWRAKWKRQHGVFGLFCQLESAVFKVAHKCAPAKEAS